jgi:hypothetical protein
MDPVIRSEFKQKFMELSDEFGLPNIVINTFVRQLDNKT